MEIRAQHVDVAVDGRLAHFAVARTRAVQLPQPGVVRVQARLDCIMNDDEPLKHLFVQLALGHRILFHADQYTTVHGVQLSASSPQTRPWSGQNGGSRNVTTACRLPPPPGYRRTEAVPVHFWRKFICWVPPCFFEKKIFVRSAQHIF